MGVRRGSGFDMGTATLQGSHTEYLRFLWKYCIVPLIITKLWWHRPSYKLQKQLNQRIYMESFFEHLESTGFIKNGKVNLKKISQASIDNLFDREQNQREELESYVRSLQTR